MKYSIALYAFFCLAVSVVSAQTMTPQETMERAAAAFREAKGIQVEFAAQAFSRKKELQAASTGVIRVMNQKFKLETDGAVTWFDGSTQWSYLPGVNEVNISQPSLEELQMLNPYSFFSLYKNGYQLQFGKRKMYKGKAISELILTASDKKKSLQQFILYIAKDSFQPSFISVQQSGGESLHIDIMTYRTKQSFPDRMFVFDKQAYPGVEVIDLR